MASQAMIEKFWEQISTTRVVGSFGWSGSRTNAAAINETTRPTTKATMASPTPHRTRAPGSADGGNDGGGGGGGDGGGGGGGGGRALLTDVPRYRDRRDPTADSDTRHGRMSVRVTAVGPSRGIGRGSRALHPGRAPAWFRTPAAWDGRRGRSMVR